MSLLLVRPTDALQIPTNPFTYLDNHSLRSGFQGAMGVSLLALLVYKITHLPFLLCFFSGAVGFAIGCVAKNVCTNYPRLVKPLVGFFHLGDVLLFTRVPLFIISLVASYRFAMLSMAMSAMSGWMAGLTFRVIPVRDQTRE